MEFTKEQLTMWAEKLIEETRSDIEISRTDAHAESYRAQMALLEIAQSALTAPAAFESWFIKVHLPGVRQSKLKAAECKLVHRVAQSAWNGCCSAILEGDDK
ncbi:hypothetical protein I9Y19_004816 [Citrobacter freundii]|uniref:Uncharacterized protein n=1 Tax=Citrobacter freundii TaxID=546 RepID=A0ABY7LAB2_CITFR|nr:hypothetical protein [Citrobacter freundii]EIJ9084869.1 hypothetical protein [Citrobacter freundii]EJH9549660.1 hypothetical protein [Citrobacter freundii]EJO6485794.1 hypothetical protein [Citrobacter freundii]EKW5688245.1 hypothetical protein [Citrobacter freundii]EKX9690381.1 hypothetical protein [Citrobacter freundii]